LEVTSQPNTDSQKASFPSCYASLAEIGKFVRQNAIASGLNDFAVYAVETAVDEACSNIIDHAYNNCDDQFIGCTCTSTPDGLVVVLRDYGKPFDPDSIIEPDTNASLDNRLAHGLGLHFIRSWMDEHKYEFSPTNGNTLTMLKRRDPA
jgi:serine/threonine-protein kinase RsbW